MLSIKNLSLTQIGGGINLIDLGASGTLSSYWSKIENMINLYAFEPNEEECKRLRCANNNLASTTYFPVAIAGKSGKYTLFETKHKHCWSLLEPNQKWLNRFKYSHLFEIECQSEIEAISLEDFEKTKEIDVDVIKLDTQGLELPILENAPSKVKSAFLIETETGFVENYKGESTFAQISNFMKENNFLLFDLNSNHRESRDNELSETSKNQEILWCEALWLKDYLKLEEQEKLDIDRVKALKSLILCANHGCIDYGLELAELFVQKKLISNEEYQDLKNENNWQLDSRLKLLTNQTLTNILNFLPGEFSKEVAGILLEVSQRNNPIKQIFSKIFV